MWRRLLLGLLAVALASPGSAFAEDLVVTTTEDGTFENCDLETCTLRDAVAAANRNDRIVLKAETYTLRLGQLDLGGTFTIQGAGPRATTIQSDGESRVALVPEGGNVTVNDVTVSGGFASDQGGGFRVEAGGSLELNRATVRYNTAASGGGISSSGTLRIFQSTVRSNYAGLGAPGNGGGIRLLGGSAQLRNTTVTDNWAIAGGDQQPSQGGGIYTAGILTMEHVTISRNLATTGMGLYQASKRERDVAMWNTLLADNGEQSCGGDVGLIDGDHNLADDKSCQLDGEGDLEEASADLLGPSDHGGPTDTDALGVASKAIDAATSARCPEVDQRGFARPAEKFDIGAVERRLPPVVTTT